MLRELKYLIAGTNTFLRVDGPLDNQFELRPFKRVYNTEDDHWFELEKRLLAAFASHSRERGIHFLLVEGLYRPALDEQMQQQITDAYGDQFDFDKVSRLLSEDSVDAGYEFVSLPRLVRTRQMDVRQFMHSDDTMHLNAEGVRLFANAVTEKIRSLGWLDNGHHVKAAVSGT